MNDVLVKRSDRNTVLTLIVNILKLADEYKVSGEATDMAIEMVLAEHGWLMSEFKEEIAYIVEHDNV